MAYEFNIQHPTKPKKENLFFFRFVQQTQTENDKIKQQNNVATTIYANSIKCVFAFERDPFVWCYFIRIDFVKVFLLLNCEFVWCACIRLVPKGVYLLIQYLRFVLHFGRYFVVCSYSKIEMERSRREQWTRLNSKSSRMYRSLNVEYTMTIADKFRWNM